MHRTKWAAAAAVVIALGATGCGASQAGTAGPATKATPSPRPPGSGPLPKSVVRTDLETSASDAGVSANAPDYARTFEGAPAGSPPSCAIGFRGTGDKRTAVDFARFKTVVNELRARDWQQSGGLRERESLDGGIGEAHAILKQRGWTITARYDTFEDSGAVTLTASDDACTKEYSGVPMG